MIPLSEIEHSTSVFALAFSPDGHLIALGGEAAADAVTVWDRGSGALVIVCSGLSSKIQSLAFSSDSSRVAAVNEYGGLGVWRIPDGALVGQKPDAKTRRGYNVYFTDTAGDPNSPVVISASSRKHKGRVGAISPSGRFNAIAQYGYIFKQHYWSTQILASCDLKSYSLDFAQDPVRLLCWSSDSAAVAVAGNSWVGIWGVDTGAFMYVPFNFTYPVYSIALVPGQRVIGMATGKRSIDTLEIPDTPLQTIWQKRVVRVLASAPQSSTINLTDRTDPWIWNERSYAYEGVHFEGMDLVWYEHQQNTLAGSSAKVQSIDEFLAKGIDLDVPEDIVDEVIVAAAKKKQAASSSGAQ